MNEEKWDKQTVAKCVYYICVHSNSKEFMDEVYKYQEQDRLSEIPTQIMNLYKQLQAAKEENEKLRNLLGKPYKRRIDLENNKLTQQNKQMKEALEKVKKDACCSNGDCEHCEYDEDCFGYDAQQALNEVNNEK